jgi:hypothetical protein
METVTVRYADGFVEDFNCYQHAVIAIKEEPYPGSVIVRDDGSDVSTGHPSASHSLLDK